MASRVNIISASSLARRIKRRLQTHLRLLGFSKDGQGKLIPFNTSKETYRWTHRSQRSEKLEKTSDFIKRVLPDLQHYFASGIEIQPELIKPVIQEVEKETWESDLFRLASLTWSVPVSAGYGRRMRFLVWDETTWKLIGIFALGDPVFNMSQRDRIIGWDGKMRISRLVNMMDAYVLGALPPYNQLLCGKLIACLIRTKEVKDAFSRKYATTTGIISGKRKNARLACVTTTSSLGRSSIYNRLRLNGTTYFESLGFTSGWGHFQIPDDLFEDMRLYLKKRKNAYSNGHKFGNGPNWRLRAVRKTLDDIGINSDLLCHNLKREIFICRLASNADRFLRGDSTRAFFPDLPSVEEVGAAARERWIIPRAERMPDFRAWSLTNTLALLHSPIIIEDSHKNGIKTAA